MVIGNKPMRPTTDGDWAKVGEGTYRHVTGLTVTKAARGWQFGKYVYRTLWAAQYFAEREMPMA